jgi:hypothetical protein
MVDSIPFNSMKERGQAMTLGTDPVIFSTVFLKSLSSDIRKENLSFALDTPEYVRP